LYRIPSERLNQRLRVFPSQTIGSHDTIDFFLLSLGFELDFFVFASLFAEVMVPFCDGGEVGPETHGDCAAEELGEAADYYEFGGAEPGSSLALEKRKERNGGAYEDRPAVRAKGTVNPSAYPMMISRITSP
jgi:hypothetical protein